MRTIVVVIFIFSIVMLQNINAELINDEIISEAQNKYGESASKRFIAIKEDLLINLKDADIQLKLNSVNRWINRLQYKSDEEVYNKSDYWATFYEFVGKNRGDCEDYTIAKYYILKELGVDPNRMKFTYVMYRKRNGEKKNHMVLSYLKVPKPKSKDDILILDNNNRMVLPASKRPNIIKFIKMINGDTGPKSKKMETVRSRYEKEKIMTLFKQMMFATSLIIFILLSSTLWINYKTTKSYVQANLYESMVNNITALSDSLARSNDDISLIAAKLAAAYDSGYFKEVSFKDGNRVIFSKKDETKSSVPQWFIHLLDLNIKETTIDVVSDWKTIGTLSIVADTESTYKSLYKTFINYVYLFFIVFIFS